LGLVDLEDEEWLDAIDGFSRDAHRALADFITNGVLVAPFCSEEITARA
jgi:hypothetical protein